MRRLFIVYNRQHDRLQWPASTPLARCQPQERRDPRGSLRAARQPGRRPMQYNGCVIGTRTTGYEINAPVVLSRDDLKQHLHLIGKTGTGKSTLLKTLIFDDLLNDRDFVLIDPLGTLAEAIVDGVPVFRTNDVIYFAPGHDLEH